MLMPCCCTSSASSLSLTPTHLRASAAVAAHPVPAVQPVRLCIRRVDCFLSPMHLILAACLQALGSRQPNQKEDVQRHQAQHSIMQGGHWHMIAWRSVRAGSSAPEVARRAQEQRANQPARVLQCWSAQVLVADLGVAGQGRVRAGR